MRQHEPLMQRMRALERVTLGDRKRRSSRSEGEYDHAERFLRKNPRQSAVETLSASEWQAIGLYCIFAFQKFRPIDGEEGDEEGLEEREDKDRETKEEEAASRVRDRKRRPDPLEKEERDRDSKRRR